MSLLKWPEKIPRNSLIPIRSVLLYTMYAGSTLVQRFSACLPSKVGRETTAPKTVFVWKPYPEPLSYQSVVAEGVPFFGKRLCAISINNMPRTTRGLTTTYSYKLYKTIRMFVVFVGSITV